MEPLEHSERVCERYPDMDARLMDDLGLLCFLTFLDHVYCGTMITGD